MTKKANNTTGDNTINIDEIDEFKRSLLALVKT